MKSSLALSLLLLSTVALANEGTAVLSQPAERTQREPAAVNEAANDTVDETRIGREGREIDRSRSYDRPVASSRERSQSRR